MPRPEFRARAGVQAFGMQLTPRLTAHSSVRTLYVHLLKGLHMARPERRPIEAESRAPREARLNLRASTKQGVLIRQAALASDKSVTEFILESATTAAEHVLADRRRFDLDAAEWKAFQVALERPAVLKPKLRTLLGERSTFDH